MDTQEIKYVNIYYKRILTFLSNISLVPRIFEVGGQNNILSCIKIAYCASFLGLLGVS